MTGRPLICTALVFSLASCARAPKAPPEPATLQHITYHRSGGFAGVDDRLEVHPDGRAAVVRRGERPREMLLTREQVALLRKRFRGFAALKSDYPPPKETADDFRYEIRYGDQTVTASEANADVPPRLRAAWQSLDAIVLQQ